MDILTFAAAVAVVGLSVNAAILAAELDKQDAALKSTREVHAMSAPATPIIQNPVYVFISFSMPKESLQQWAAQAKKVHAPLVIQGLVEDSFTKTQQAVAALSSEHQSGVVLDPRLFRQYHIHQVPSVVVVNPTALKPCLPNQSCWQSDTPDVVSGDIGLEAALRIVADRGDNAVIAQRLLTEEKS
ncbi:MAG: type-F conjugative transfer system pilin assembly protein TrbC [Proteobacteria bacterium]|nr:type-F conjugative transfer system pilin assembly protein TrbC [Pseudomonadota bacterium]